MASATGIPDAAITQDAGEDEPLLGRRGGASQEEGKSIWYNLIIGTAIIAQAGIILLAASVWASIFLNLDWMLFSAHPLLNSAGLLILTQAILILQPTHTTDQKRSGTAIHFVIINLGVYSLIAGLVVIEVNKFAHNGTHFVSSHAILGLISYILLAIQAFVGFTQYYTPSLYGSVENAKSLYKYHRISGYIILTMMLATVAAATQTDFNKSTIKIKLWAVILTSLLVLIGIIPRIKKQKLGLKPSARPTIADDLAHE